MKLNVANNSLTDHADFNWNKFSNALILYDIKMFIHKNFPLVQFLCQHVWQKGLVDRDTSIVTILFPFIF